MLMRTRIPPRRRDLTIPVLPQAVNNVIDVSRLTSDIIVRVQQYIGMKHGDTLIGYFGTIRGQPQIVPYNPENLPPSIDLLFNRFLPNGPYEVYYTAEDLLANTSASPSVPITIVNALPDLYPPPEFPDAKDGILYYNSIIGHGGTRIRARYQGIETGDKVTFHWSGTDAQGNAVPASAFTSGPILVSALDKFNGYVETLIPKQYILVLGDGGVGTGCYVVQPVAGGQYTSASASVTIDWQDLYAIDMNVTTNAPISDTDDYPYLKPYNRVSVFGRPGLVVTAAVGQAALIDDSMATALVTLDESGMGSFRVSTKLLGAVNVAVYPPRDQASFQTTMAFQAYQVGAAGVHAYRASTNAPNDGYTPCSVYLIAGKGVKGVEASVTGSALINGWASSTTIPVHNDGSATLNIIDDVAETVTLTLRAGGNTQSPQTLQFTFVDFPNFQA